MNALADFSKKKTACEIAFFKAQPFFPVLCQNFLCPGERGSPTPPFWGEDGQTTSPPPPILTPTVAPWVPCSRPHQPYLRVGQVRRAPRHCHLLSGPEAELFDALVDQLGELPAAAFEAHRLPVAAAPAGRSLLGPASGPTAAEDNAGTGEGWDNAAYPPSVLHRESLNGLSAGLQRS